VLEEIAKNAWHIPILMALILVYGFLLNRVLFRPVQSVLDERKGRIREAGALSEQSRASLKQRFEEYEQAVLEAHRRGTHIKEIARGQAYDYRSKVLAEVKAEMDGEIKETEAELRASMAVIKRELDETTPDLVKLMATKILGREVAL
jgi:F0F1-type ATP synthase membrane subunit b/b'